MSNREKMPRVLGITGRKALKDKILRPSSKVRAAALASRGCRIRYRTTSDTLSPPASGQFRHICGCGGG